MILRYALLPLAALSLLQVAAQGIVTLTDGGGNTVNGSLIHKPLTPGYHTDTVKVYAELTGSTPKQVNVRRYEIWPVAGSQNFFCWGVCYLPVASGVNLSWDSQHPLNLNPAWTYSDFGAYYMPEGQTAVTRFRFVWYDMANPNGADSSWVDIDFGGTVGILESPLASLDMTLWPNPTAGQPVQLDYRLPGDTRNASLVVYNALGERVKTIAPLRAEGRLVLPTADLVSGIYFVNLEQGGRMLGTRRLVVTH